MKKRNNSSYNQAIIKDAFKGSIAKLTPKEQLKNPIIFVVYLGTFITGFIWLYESSQGVISLFGFEFWVFACQSTLRYAHRGGETQKEFYRQILAYGYCR